MKKLLVAAAAAAAALLTVPAGAASAQDDVSVMLLHGIPGVPVDVYVAGAELLPDFQPGDMQDISGYGGETLTDVAVVPAGGDISEAVIEVPELAVPASGNWTVIAHLDADGNPTITPYENDTTAAGSGEGRLVVRHDAAAPAVDILVGGEAVISNLTNPDEAALDLPAGEIAGAQIAPAGGDPIADVPTVTLAAGTGLVVYAVGSLDGGTFTFYTQEYPLADGSAVPAPGAEDEGGDGTPQPTAVNTGGELSSSSNSLVLFAAAAGLFALAGGAVALRRRTIES
ncbi:MAG: DUF4397 domain-containing protein [Ilumatobacteraceae bacterium]|nr:DUF4397 domain-containing protein [Ilumatobacteraceae bacterium]